MVLKSGTSHRSNLKVFKVRLGWVRFRVEYPKKKPAVYPGQPGGFSGFPRYPGGFHPGGFRNPGGSGRCPGGLGEGSRGFGQVPRGSPIGTAGAKFLDFGPFSLRKSCF